MYVKFNLEQFTGFSNSEIIREHLAEAYLKNVKASSANSVEFNFWLTLLQKV